jgi:hypothetical protein
MLIKRLIRSGLPSKAATKATSGTECCAQGNYELQCVEIVSRGFIERRFVGLPNF